MANEAVVMSYVLCPNPDCGDPVGGRVPQPPEELKLTCLHCKQTFPFEPGDVRNGVVSDTRENKRWRVESLAHLMS